MKPKIVFIPRLDYYEELLSHESFSRKPNSIIYSCTEVHYDKAEYTKQLSFSCQFLKAALAMITCKLHVTQSDWYTSTAATKVQLDSPAT